WLIGTSFKHPEETFVYPPRWIPAAAPQIMRSPCIDQDGRAAPLDADPLAQSTDPGFRGLAIGEVIARDARRLQHPISRDAVTLSLENATQIDPADPQRHLSYTQQPGETLSIRLRIDSSALPANTAAIIVPMRQDRSWNRLRATLQIDGRRFATRDALYTGDKTWRELTFARADLEPADERALGVWPMDDIGPALDASVHLTLDIEMLPRWRASLAKYTQSYRDAWHADTNWPRYLVNSAVLVVLNVIGQIIACSMAGYAFARLRWPGRDGVFVLVLATMMLPGAVTMIPVFLIFKTIGWYNTLWPLVVPAFFGAPFFIFMLRQFMKSIPRELEEAAVIDGCGFFGIYWRIILPLMKPALAAVAIFTFMGTWNEFMGPLIYLNDARLYPLSLGLFNFRGEYGSEFGMLMAASVIMTLPVIALFFFCQRYFIEGVTLTGVKG
ncbi:MAG TPA: carbohydrate ABC transporter permease, partial [Tepidisphaeraceae bacterium]|nr:carbohydrate ABC transporter permease [Tepidisphaeraceae bacterium]